jgi:hypothetical protein
MAFNVSASVAVLSSCLRSALVIIMRAQLEDCNVIKQHSVSPVNIDICIVAQCSSALRIYRNMFRRIYWKEARKMSMTDNVLATSLSLHSTTSWLYWVNELRELMGKDRVNSRDVFSKAFVTVHSVVHNKLNLQKKCEMGTKDVVGCQAERLRIWQLL